MIINSVCERELLEKPEMRKQCCRTRSPFCADVIFLVVFCSVVVKALARLLKVAVAFFCRREPRLCQILPVEGAATKLLPFSLGPGSLDG